MTSPKILLTIGGSDSGGAAGIQADLKTWTMLGVHGMSALTAVTAQNSLGVEQVEWLSAEFLSAQLAAVMSDYGLDAAKTGFLGRRDLIEAIASQIHSRIPLVVDPVLVNQYRYPMFDEDIIEAYRQHLYPLATVVTPNPAEAELLSNVPIIDLDDAREAAEVIHSDGAAAVLITGFLKDDEKVNILYDGSFSYYPMPRIETFNVHGSGDTLAAAIATRLAHGDSLYNAIEFGTEFTHAALERAKNWELGEGHGPLAHFR